MIADRWICGTVEEAICATYWAGRALGGLHEWSLRTLRYFVRLGNWRVRTSLTLWGTIRLLLLILYVCVVLQTRCASLWPSAWTASYWTILTTVAIVVLGSRAVVVVAIVFVGRTGDTGRGWGWGSGVQVPHRLGPQIPYLVPVDVDCSWEMLVLSGYTSLSLYDIKS